MRVRAENAQAHTGDNRLGRGPTITVIARVLPGPPTRDTEATISAPGPHARAPRAQRLRPARNARSFPEHTKLALASTGMIAPSRSLLSLGLNVRGSGWLAAFPQPGDVCQLASFARILVVQPVPLAGMNWLERELRCLKQQMIW